MDSSNRPAAMAVLDPARARRAAALVGFVWTIAALPFLFGLVRCPTAELFHAPCPGCGMTRALQLLIRGDLHGSLLMHPLALPTALVQAALAVATVIVTWEQGAPWSILRARWGRLVVVLTAVVLVLDILLWIARALGAFGGPVPV